MKIKLVNPIHPNIDQIKPQFEGCLNNGLVTNNSKYVKLFEKEQFSDGARMEPPIRSMSDANEQC